MPSLLITNGDSTAGLLREAGVAAEILPWRDALHEGPTAPGPLAACSAHRAPWLAARFGLDEAEVAAGFRERDQLIAASTRFDRIELWFEHDLYDQLQIAQAVTAIGARRGLLIVQADEFLGLQTPDTILRFADRARPIDAAGVQHAASVWGALTASTPVAVAELAASDARGPFPFMKSALLRFLQELPDVNSGLGLTEERILALLADGARTGAEVFRTAIATEDAAFMGDWSFFGLIEDMAGADRPLIRIDGEPADTGPVALARRQILLTPEGQAVLRGGADHVALNGLDRWWGGTRLAGHHVWRYDRAARHLVPPQEAETAR